MEAGARPAEQDKDFNDPRFQFLAAVNMPRKEREMGHWYTAIPPICREGNNMGPVDFFGRKMIESIDKRYRIGVINVSVAGAKIELWDKDDYKAYIDNERDWMKAIVNQYDGNPTASSKASLSIRVSRTLTILSGRSVWRRFITTSVTTSGLIPRMFRFLLAN